MFHRRLAAPLSAASAACVIAGLGVGLAPAAPAAPTAAPAAAVAPAPAASTARAARPAYAATIRRTRHGIPHITARSFSSLGFGSGYAAAQTSACTLADTLVTARGQRSRWFGPNGRYNDQVTLDASNL